MKAVAFAVPGDLATPTGGYAYDRRMIAELGALGWQVEVLDLGEGFPFPAADVRAAACRNLAALPAGRPIVADGLALSVLPEAAEALRHRHPLIALVHHPLAWETGLSATQSAALRESECAALACVRHVVTTSPATARLLVAHYRVPPDRLTIVVPGTDRASVPPQPHDRSVSLLAVGTVIPRKGYDVLVAALAKLVELPWRLVIVGDCSRHQETKRKLDADIAHFGLAGRIGFTGAVAPERLPPLYAAADLFVLASRFEGYGMAYAEAVAHGLPIVGTTAGAIPDTVPPEAGVLVPPDDADALAITLRRLIENPKERQQLAAGARAAAAELPSWSESARRMAQVLDKVA